MLLSITTLASTAIDLLHRLSKPSSKYIHDKEELEQEHNRNKTVLLVHAAAFLQFLFNVIISNGDLAVNIQGLTGPAFIMIFSPLCCHFNMHPQIFKSVYNIYTIIFGVMYIRNSEHGVIGAFMVAPVLSIVIYFLTGSMIHFLFHLFCQIVLINTSYAHLIRETLKVLNLERLPKDFAYFSNQNIVYCFISTVFMHYTMKNAFLKIKVTEMKKDEVEKQKTFLLGFSHELRNLINSLMGNVKLCLLQKPSDKLKELLLNAELCAELLLHSVNNILDTGKVEVGDLEINAVPTRIYDTLERIWGICSEMIKRKELRGRIKIQKNIPEIIELDHYRITQIFLNLVGNAVKYTDSGQVDITVEWLADEEMSSKCFEPFPFNEANDQDEGLFEKSQAMSILSDDFLFLTFFRKKINRNLLTKSPSYNTGILKVTVSDTGCGVLREELDILFGKFIQGSTDPSKKKLGTGLGLFISKELCKRMGGDVQIFSKRGIGSAFTFCVPVQPVTENKSFFFDLEGIQRVVYHRGLKAMIVDDELLSQSVVKNFLTKLNVNAVDTAENGSIACRIFEERARRKDYVNIVTMDIQMPVMDGKLAAQKIREIEASRGMEPCLLIMISGNCSESEINECMNKNGKIKANAFIKKPVNIDELCRVISCHFTYVNEQKRVRFLTE